LLYHLSEAGCNYAAHLAKLESNADNESFFDIVFGTNCYSKAVRELKQDCSNMSTDASLWLAFHLTNCFLGKNGRSTYPCASRVTAISQCTSGMDRDDFLVFSQFVQNINGMCLFIANADFNRRAEIMLNALFQAGSTATAKVITSPLCAMYCSLADY
jgi:hypothetical protein